MTADRGTSPGRARRSPAALRRALAVYLVADPDRASRDLVGDVTAAVGAGATAVQLRSKRLADGPFLALAERLLAVCRDRGVLFVVNDRLDVALAVGADGLHVGVADLPLGVARRLGGEGMVLGYSPETDAQAAASGAEGADYVGLGPVFATGSKPDAGEAIGLPTLRRRVRLAGLPSVGIGGITTENAGDVVDAGADGVAVISAILRAADPTQATRGLAAQVGARIAPP